MAGDMERGKGNDTISEENEEKIKAMMVKGKETAKYNLEAYCQEVCCVRSSNYLAKNRTFMQAFFVRNPVTSTNPKCRRRGMSFGRL